LPAGILAAFRFERDKRLVQRRGEMTNLVSSFRGYFLPRLMAQRAGNQETSTWNSMMMRNNRSTILSDLQASQGIKLGHMRYVLGISLGLSVLAALVLWSYFTG
jgi:hypothetical protein